MFQPQIGLGDTRHGERGEGGDSVDARDEGVWEQNPGCGVAEGSAIGDIRVTGSPSSPIIPSRMKQYQLGDLGDENESSVTQGEIDDHIKDCV
jgi:hypothetical protein